MALGAISNKTEIFSLFDLEAELETIDKSTLFRTLTLFQQHLIVHTIDDGSGSLKYSVCDEECGAVIGIADLEQKFEKADKVTLYRTLKTFEENKLIHSIDDGTGSVKYALCKETCQFHPEDLHVHFLCTKCKQTYCLTDIPVPSVNLPVHFTLETINMVVKGICVNCI